MVPAPRFLFRGEAVGVAGHIRRPVDVFIPAQASVSLPIIGGRGVSAVNGGYFGEVLAFGSAVVAVYGDYDPPQKAVAYTQGNHGRNNLPTLTRVSTEVCHLSIHSSSGRSGGHTLTAARMATTVESRHPRRPGLEPRFTTRLEIDGLALDGNPIEIGFADELLAVEGFRDLYTTSSGDGGKASPRRKFAQLFETAAGTEARGTAEVPFPDYEVCTGCAGIRLGKNAPAKVIGPNRLHVKDFGTIYFAEMILSPVDRRLALMRIELGSPRGGDLLIAASGIDGHTWPP